MDVVDTFHYCTFLFQYATYLVQLVLSVIPESMQTVKSKTLTQEQSQVSVELYFSYCPNFSEIKKCFHTDNFDHGCYAYLYSAQSPLYIIIIRNACISHRVSYIYYSSLANTIVSIIY